MCINITKTIKKERLRRVFPIINNELALKYVAKFFPYSQRKLECWVVAYKKDGESGLESKSTRPKSHHKEEEIRIKKRIIKFCGQTKKCVLKLKWQLKKKIL